MIYLITVVIITGHYTGYSYVEPFMDKATHMQPRAITLTLCLFGIAGLIGSLLMSRFYTRYCRKIITVTCFTLPAVLLLLLPLSWVSPWALAGLCILWGMAITVYNISFQNEIIMFSPKHSAVAMSIYSGIFNLGIGLGALMGGAVCENTKIDYIGIVGGIIALCAAVYALFRFIPRISQRELK